MQKKSLPNGYLSDDVSIKISDDKQRTNTEHEITTLAHTFFHTLYVVEYVHYLYYRLTN